MTKLTPKQNELVELIKNRQLELTQDLYIKYCGSPVGICLVKIIENNTKCEVVEKKLNTKIVYTLMDKGILSEKKINENLNLVGLVN